MNKQNKNVNQYEACDRILRHVLENPNVWISPIDIQNKFLSSVPIQKITYLFDIMAYTLPEPVSVKRNIYENFWEIKANEYTNQFLLEGGFAELYNLPNQEIRKVLFLSASPSDQDRLRVDKELRKIEEQLDAAKYRDLLSFEKKVAVKIDTITKALLEFEPQIVHFSGHGNEEAIMLENEEGNSAFFPLNGLEKLFSFFQNTIECVLLNSCYSENQAEVISMQGISVIGMSKSISDDIAIDFAKGFYQGLGAGKDIENSFKIGLIMISAYAKENSIPVLWKNGEKLKV